MLYSPAAKSCVEMGYSEQEVENAIKHYQQLNNTCAFSGRDLCEILMEIEEQKQETSTSVRSTDEESESSNSSDNEEQPKNDQNLDHLEEENRKLKENLLCKICLDQKADILFLPCGHLTSCPQCSMSLLSCPLCRKKINGKLKVYQ